MTMLKSQRLYALSFAERIEDGASRSSAVFAVDEGIGLIIVDYATYEGMGEPKTITVTLEPGDGLKAS